MQGEAAPDDAEAPGQEVAAKKPFQFLSLSVLREYLAKEFADADYACVGGFDLERVIDDFVFMVLMCVLCLCVLAAVVCLAN